MADTSAWSFGETFEDAVDAEGFLRNTAYIMHRQRQREAAAKRKREEVQRINGECKLREVLEPRWDVLQ